MERLKLPGVVSRRSSLCQLNDRRSDDDAVNIINDFINLIKEKQTDKKESEKIMSKQIWRPGNMLYPVPAVLVSVADSAGKDNLITIAWTGTVCSDPAMTYISR